MSQTIKLKRGTTTPTTSNIVDGEVAIDTSAQKFYINDNGTVKEIGGGGNSNAYTRSLYTASATSPLETTFSATYTVGFVEVYLNGVKLISGTDYTATNGTSVVLASGAEPGDTVEIIAFSTFDVANIEVVDDTTPQLGGNLDLNSYNITGTGSWQGTAVGIPYGGTGANTQETAAHALLDNVTLTAATVAGTDKVLIQDADGSGVLKTATASEIAGLAGTIGSETPTNSVTLTSASKPLQTVTTDDVGYSVTLPDATTLSEGPATFTIKNAGFFDLAVYDSAGTCIGFIRGAQTGIINLVDNATSAGVWSTIDLEPVGYFGRGKDKFAYSVVNSVNCVQSVVEFDTNKFLLTLNGATSGTNIVATVYDANDNTWGVSATVSTGSTNKGNVDLTVIDTSNVLLTYGSSTAVAGRVLSIAGDKTITANTASSISSPATPNNVNYKQQFKCQKFGSTYVLLYLSSTNWAITAATISGTTVTWGTQSAVQTNTTEHGSEMYSDGATGIYVIVPATTSVGDIYVTHYEISGTTLTEGTASEINSMSGHWVSCYLTGTNHVAMFTLGSSGDNHGRIISHSSGTINISTASNLWGANLPSSAFSMMPLSDRVLIMGQANSCKIACLRDSSGTALSTYYTANEIPTSIEYTQMGGPLFFDFDNSAMYVVSAYSFLNQRQTSSYKFPYGHALIVKVTENAGTPIVEEIGAIAIGQTKFQKTIGSTSFNTRALANTYLSYTDTVYRSGDYKRRYWYLLNGNKHVSHLDISWHGETLKRWTVDKQTAQLHEQRIAVPAPITSGNTTDVYMPIFSNSFYDLWDKPYFFNHYGTDSGSAPVGINVFRII